MKDNPVLNGTVWGSQGRPREEPDLGRKVVDPGQAPLD